MSGAPELQRYAIVSCLVLLFLAAMLGWVAALSGPTVAGLILAGACAWTVVVMLAVVAPVAVWGYPYEDPWTR